MSRGVYGTKGESSFRRTWDKDEYSAKAAERALHEKVEAKERYDKKMGFVKRETTPPDVKMKEARRDKLNYEENLNKLVVVPAAAAIGKQGKGVGFYCEYCDLTYKDNLSYVDHLNSKQHTRAIGLSVHVEKATLEQVRARLAWLKEKKRQSEQEEEYDIEQRLQERRRIIDEERKNKKDRKRAKRAGGGACQPEGDDETTHMTLAMGFSGFGTTKT